MFPAFVPRDDVRLLKRQRVAANCTVMARLKQNLASDRYGNGGAVVGHRSDRLFQLPYKIGWLKRASPGDGVESKM